MAEPAGPAEGGAEGAGHVVVGTAGHIDHGKTSLVRALTGTDTDRLPEEKKRGITIELGFASWELEPGLVASVIDVPGHEKFVRTMAAGAGGVDVVVLVVAADDGVMPQTAEHLAICQLLGVQRGVVAVTKTDLVEPDLVELVVEDVTGAVQGTFLEGAPVIPVSAHRQEGLDALRGAVLAAVQATRGRRAAGPAFLPVDRVFTRPGFGTVVTGTLLTGVLQAGQSIDLVPGPRGEPKTGITVRGLQIHGASVEQTGPGTRLAVNLRGVETEDVRRGDALVAAGSRRPVTEVHVALQLLAGAAPVEENDELSLHVGTEDVLVRVVPLDREPVAPGTTRPARLLPAHPIACYPGQRFIVRKPGLHGQGTVGGGEVLDPEPRSGKGSFPRWREVALAMMAGEERERAAAVLTDARADGVSEEELARRLPPGADAAALAQALVDDGRAVRAQDEGAVRYVLKARVAEVQEEVRAAVARFHDDRPVLGGVSVGELKTGLPPHLRSLAEPAVALLIDEGKLSREGGVIQVAGWRRPAGAQAQLEKVRQAIAKAGLTAPGDDDLEKATDVKGPRLRDVLSELKREGAVDTQGGLHFDPAALEGLLGRVRAHFDSGKSELTTADFKEIGGGISRKYAIPLLEWLDGRGVTRRQGDVRVRGRS